MSTRAAFRDDAQLVGLLAHMRAVREFWRHVAAIKETLEAGDLMYFRQLWNEIPRESQIALYRAPTNRAQENGAVWTVAEKRQIDRAFGKRHD